MQMQDDASYIPRPEPTRWRCGREHCANAISTFISLGSPLRGPYVAAPAGQYHSEARRSADEWRARTVRVVFSTRQRLRILNADWLTHPRVALIGQKTSRHFEPNCVIGINCGDAKSANTHCCYGNRLIYHLKFYPAPNRLRNVT